MKVHFGTSAITKNWVAGNLNENFQDNLFSWTFRGPIKICRKRNNIFLLRLQEHQVCYNSANTFHKAWKPAKIASLKPASLIFRGSLPIYLKFTQRSSFPFPFREYCLVFWILQGGDQVWNLPSHFSGDRGSKIRLFWKLFSGLPDFTKYRTIGKDGIDTYSVIAGEYVWYVRYVWGP